jgi:hypothetical protein
LELGLILVDEKNETEIKEVLNYLFELALKYAKEGQEIDTKRLIEDIKKIGKAAAVARLETVVVDTLLLFSPVAREACRQHMENAFVSIALAFG